MRHRRSVVMATALVAACLLSACTERDAPSSPQTFQHGGPFSVTIAAAGDVLTHVAVREDAQKNAGGRGYDFRPMFAEVRPLLSAADLALCHMETPVSQSDTDLTQPGTLVFNTPHEVLDAVKDAGYDGCDFASNHTWDKGLAGLKSTTAAFAAAGLEYAGPNPDEQFPEAIARYEVRGITVAHLAYTITITNRSAPTSSPPPGAAWLGAAMWPVQKAEGILAAAHQARKDGADLVVVSLHWGTEYEARPTAEQAELAGALLSSPDVDLILGTHVHVIQPCQTIGGKLAFYGLGNSLSNQSPQSAPDLKPETQDGVVATVTVTRDASGQVTDSATYQPTWVDLSGHVIRLATQAGTPTSWNRTVSALGAAGGCAATPAGG